MGLLVTLPGWKTAHDRGLSTTTGILAIYMGIDPLLYRGVFVAGACSIAAEGTPRAWQPASALWPGRTGTRGAQQPRIPKPSGCASRFAESTERPWPFAVSGAAVHHCLELWQVRIRARKRGC